MKPVFLEDTIAALSSAPGEGGIALIRLSGRDALAIADRVFRPKAGLPPSRQKSHTLRYGFVVDPFVPVPGGAVDEALLAVMRAPRSYTGEDVVELSCHGGRFVVQKALDLLVRCGARPAEPGEFTRRAFLAGRMDLAQSEAVLDLIRAKSDRAFEAARSQLAGDLSRFVRRIRDELARILSHIEASIDFPDDRIEPMADRSVLERLKKVRVECSDLVAQARGGVIVRDGLKVVLAGPPNAGKSSLMNALVRKDRVIVSPEPGTTRDTIEEDVSIGGFRVRLVDTAGLQEPVSAVEREGISRSREEIASADLVLYVLDGSAEPLPGAFAPWEGLAAKKRLLILNKADLGPPRRGQPSGEFPGALSVIRTSCLDGTGIPELERRIREFAAEEAPRLSEETWVLSVRHLDHFRKAEERLRLAVQAYEEGLSAEFGAVDLKGAMDELGQVVGEVVTDDILDLIFSRFCIGK